MPGTTGAAMQHPEDESGICLRHFRVLKLNSCLWANPCQTGETPGNGLNRGNTPKCPEMAGFDPLEPPENPGFGPPPGGVPGGPFSDPKIREFVQKSTNPNKQTGTSVPTGRVIKYPQKCVPPGPPPGPESQNLSQIPVLNIAQNRLFLAVPSRAKMPAMTSKSRKSQFSG
jgi:hypothetical protein